ncbi:MAG: PRD domain-containing protein [Collinsella sp.]|nr:PRD domain-containing protein [Collinsella sp.]
MISSKEGVLDWLERATAEYGLRETAFFQASCVSEELHISRSLASQYMNALHTEGELVKVSARPALFYSKKAIEERYSIRLVETVFLSNEELVSYVDKLRMRRYNFEDLIGANGSCKGVVERIRAAACYPPKGLPLLLVGSMGSGKTMLREATSRWCLSEGIIPSEADAEVVDAAALSESELLRFLFDGETGALKAGARKLVWIVNSQALSDAGWSQALSYFDGRDVGCHSRLFFEYVGSAKDVAERSVLAQVPLICFVPDFAEREPGEREAYVYRAFQKEARRIGREVKISSSVARRLSERSYPDNLHGLNGAVRLTCANAMAENVRDASSALLVYSSHVPAAGSEAFDGSYEFGSDPVFVDVDLYDPFASSREALSLLADFLESLSQGVATDSFNRDARSQGLLSKYFEYIAHHQEPSFSTRASEVAAAEIVRHAFERCGMNEPVNFTNHLINCLSFSRSNRGAVAEWSESNRSLLSTCMVLVRQQYGEQLEIVSLLGRSLRDCFGWKMDEGAIVTLSFYLHWYAGERVTSCRGVIVAHGYSTASSIADSVNTMLGNHVFDAVDMPLEVPTEQVVEALQKHFSRSAVNSDLLIMVDMGSLEVIGERLNLSFNTDIGVINNVSTASALEAGAAMLQRLSLSDVLERVQRTARTSYSINKNRVLRDCIVFTSENGVPAAARIAELFVKSLPRSIDVDIVTCDYFEILDAKSLPSELADRNVLFIFGASDPHVEGVRFVSLEDIVGLTPDTEVSFNLEGYLSTRQMNELKKGLVRNFSLENLMGHLTVLEPTRLMDAVSHSIECLQAGINTHFSYKTIMRLYIHTSYLVERLVTKDVLEYADSEAFEREHARFVSLVRASFENITGDYGVDLPISEINYLYDLIQLEIQTSDRPE